MFSILLLILGLANAFEEDKCQDHTWQCITWKHYCNDPMNKVYMEMNCRETCGLCPKCQDESPRCGFQSKYCHDKANYEYMKKKCRKTCNFCTIPTTTPPPPPTPTWKITPPGKCGVVKTQGGRIINGIDAEKGVWPWQVLVKFMNDSHCGGSIINPFWIITAAHCLKGKEPLMSEFKVVVGDHDFNVDEGTEVSLGVSKMIVHEKYDRRTLDYDVGLIKLNRPVPFDKYSATICLPKKDEVVPIGTNCFITGWGKIDPYDVMHHKLQQAVLPIVDNTKCRNLNTNTTNLPITDRMLCAGHGPKSTTGGCHGDSGGPFVCQTGPEGRWVLHGSVSWGSGKCDTSEAYTVFSRMTYFRDWIDHNVATN